MTDTSLERTRVCDVMTPRKFRVFVYKRTTVVIVKIPKDKEKT